MSQRTANKSATVRNPKGLHLRPIDEFAKLARRFSANIEVIKNGEPVDGKSVMSMLLLAAQHGDQLSIRATGEDAEAAVAALAEFIEHASETVEQTDEPS